MDIGKKARNLLLTGVFLLNSGLGYAIEQTPKPSEFRPYFEECVNEFRWFDSVYFFGFGKYETIEGIVFPEIFKELDEINEIFDVYDNNSNINLSISDELSASNSCDKIIFLMNEYRDSWNQLLNNNTLPQKNLPYKEYNLVMSYDNSKTLFPSLFSKVKKEKENLRNILISTP